ncbi:uncharacterized protein [Dermacentor andersoni]|uniref:uncharacterized protein n=1 Tax=Dermacentor andersoni TaxID=34620 RepID=UPI0021554381|nr:uncharacterized protein LOC126519283 [Dermacentor andersoni]
MWQRRVIVSTVDADAIVSSPQPFSAFAMTQKDLDVLCDALAEMSAEELLSLKKADIWWLPDLEDDTAAQAMRAIRHSLERFDALDARTFLVAWLYCCLAERQVLRSWRSYRISGAPSPAVARKVRFILHERLASVLKYPGCHTNCAKTESEGVVYACVMATPLGDPSLEHDVIGLCAPRSLPYLFVHAATRCEPRVTAALHVVLQKDPEKILEGHFDKLGLAIARCREHRADDGAQLMSNAPDDKTGPVLKTCDRNDETAADQPGQPSVAKPPLSRTEKDDSSSRQSDQQN